MSIKASKLSSFLSFVSFNYIILVYFRNKYSIILQSPGFNVSALKKYSTKLQIGIQSLLGSIFGEINKALQALEAWTSQRVKKEENLSRDINEEFAL